MVKRNEFSLIKAEINHNYKDQFLIELSNLNVVHIKPREESKIKKELDEKDPLKEKIKDLRKNLNNLYRRLEISELDVLELKIAKDDRIEFTARDLPELITHIVEEIDFYTNRVAELNSYIAKGIIELENLKLIKICYRRIEKLNLNAEKIDSLKQFKFRILTTFSKNLTNLKNLFEQTRIAKDNMGRFAGINEVVQNIEEYNWAEHQFESTVSNRLSFKFFLPSRKKEEVVQSLFTIFKDNITIQSIDISKKHTIKESFTSKKGKIKKYKKEPTLKEDYLKQNETSEMHKEEDLRESSPTIMKNFFLIRPFEAITRLYGTPTYSEIDPTPVIAFTFPILFGLMFGDIGHGLILIISGLIGGLLFRKRGGDTANFSWIIFFCGWAAFFTGFLYGEFLGHHEIEIFGKVLWDFEENPIIIPIIGSLNNPLENIMSVFTFAIYIGVFHINLGWFIQFLNYWKQKRKYLAFSDSLMKILLLIGGTILIFGFGFDIYGWLSPPYPILLTLIPGVLLLLLKPLGKIFKISYLQEESFGGLLGEGSIEAFDTVLSVVSNVASYTRLLALALAHIALLTSINAMTGLIEGEGIGVDIINLIGAIFGNMIVILLEGLLVFINTIRLHFYEFFFKFYQGSGIDYFPFYLDNDYSILKFRAEAEKDIISEEIEKEIDTQLVKEEIDKAISYISKKFA
ncbi:hypothetical protein ES703_85797 [subsurface metagenome]